jgi:prepilin-type N-terminal cleavage/methylation domain-containing protein
VNAPNISNEQGFTVTEVVIAVIILSVGLLALASTGALTTRMIGRGQRSAVAATFASQRLERLRPAACIPAQRVDGSEILYRGSAAVATNTWRFIVVNTAAPPAAAAIQIRLTTTYVTSQGKTRAEITETAVSCLL